MNKKAQAVIQVTMDFFAWLKLEKEMAELVGPKTPELNEFTKLLWKEIQEVRSLIERSDH